MRCSALHGPLVADPGAIADLAGAANCSLTKSFICALNTSPCIVWVAAAHKDHGYVRVTSIRCTQILDVAIKAAWEMLNVYA